MTPSHAQENLREAGRAEGASCFTTFEIVKTNLRSGCWHVHANRCQPTLAD